MLKFIFVTVLSVLLSGVLAQSIITIEDGLEVVEGSYPWSTYIEILHDETMESTNADCFGALISPLWVFTLAQCSLTNQNTYRLNFGAVNFTNAEVTMISRNYIIYPTYDPFINVNLNNVGLIELPFPISNTNRISPISLPWEIAENELTGMVVHFIGRRLILNEGNFYY